jgi:signal transduction histidine kinase
MKFAFDIPPRYLVAATGAIGLLMISSAYWELDQSRRELSHVVHEEAIALVESIDRGSVNTILATDIENALNAEDNAWLINTWMTPVRSRDQLCRCRRQQSLPINLFDRQGQASVNHIPDDGHVGLPDRFQPGEVLAPIFRGEVAELVLGLKEARHEDGQRYAVAIRRTHPDGGAIVVNLDAADLLAFRKRIGIGKLIRDLGDNSGIEYAALQDAEGIIAASGGVTELSSFVADTLVQYVMAHDTTRTRETTFAGKEVFEVLHPLVLERTTAGVLRIGLSMDELRAMESRMQRRMIIITLVLLVLASLVTMIIVAGRNYRRVEQQLQRTEKLTALGELASGVAHEIRNPLNAIAMIAQRFEKEFTPRRGTAEYRTLTTVLRTEAQRVNGIIQQFLRFARPPRLHREQIDVHPFLQQMANLFQSQARAKGVVFTVEEEWTGEMMLDRNQMTQALLNLLLNALEATPAGGRITLACRAGDNQVRFVVTDTGQGIPSEALDAIFNLYYTPNRTALEWACRWRGRLLPSIRAVWRSPALPTGDRDSASLSPELDPSLRSAVCSRGRCGRYRRLTSYPV